MAALTLSAPQSVIMAGLDALLDQAFQFGVNNNSAVQIIPPMVGYNQLTTTQKQATRNVFLASIAAALAAGVT